MMLTEAVLSLILPTAWPPTWPPNRLLGAPIEVYEPYIVPRILPSDVGLSIYDTGQIRAKLEDIITLEGPAEILGSRADFAPATAVGLIEYEKLTDNWDGEGATAPSLEAIGSALSMLAATPVNLVAPKPMVLASGEVALYWDWGDIYAEIGFDDAGTYYAFAARHGSEPVHLDDMPVEDEEGRTVFPTAVLEILSPEPST
jgi:hypothetical protein